MTDYAGHARIVDIGGCDPCLLRDGIRCYHPSCGEAGRRIPRSDGVPPAWCPLRERPMLLRLRTASGEHGAAIVEGREVRR